ncbi:hypothetical protein [Rothia mucilaginosa]|uniref:hypothetical protein n=1 Tax=Rothia mucilaginosa TaxID=43675 RepID=UPI00205D87AB|nr:hypothetical protein [Rothia mucilaginosa]UQF83217.1 MAG: hypothetical protein M3I37_01195 [Rothia mucilaginosa]
MLTVPMQANRRACKTMIAEFIGWITDILNALIQMHRGEDVMGIFFNEFNRYKRMPTDGQVFSREHITI